MLTTGTTLFTGGEPATAALAALTALALPPALVAWTTTRRVRPSSDLAGAYVWAVAAEMFTHDAPELLQSCHWYP